MLEQGPGHARMGISDRGAVPRSARRGTRGNAEEGGRTRRALRKRLAGAGDSRRKPGPIPSGGRSIAGILVISDPVFAVALAEPTVDYDHAGRALAKG